MSSRDVEQSTPQPRVASAYNSPVAVGTAFHARTFPLAGTLSFRDWAASTR